MQIDATKYVTKKKGPPHEKAAIVDMFGKFIGGIPKKEYGFWLKMVGRCSFSQALDIIKSLETLPIEYNKAGVIVNKLKQLNKK